jgi:oligopeptide/dipeptide ABC transporter ATP-binding protein
VESGDTETIMRNPAHPYTLALILASMGIKRGSLADLGDKIFNNPSSVPGGCRFSSRCPFSTSKCEEQEPPEVNLGNSHNVRCHYSGDILNFTTRNEIRPGISVKQLRKEMNSTS